MAESLSTLLQRNPEYDQARWIDERGMERVRVDRSQNEERVRVIPQPELQDKSDRYFFKESVKLPLGEIYISKIDLNIDNGKISVPYRPTIRFATPIADSAGQPRGILIVNYLAAGLLDRFRKVTSGSGRLVSLVNADGYWLSSSVPEDEWGFMFDRPVTMQARDPAIWQQIVQAPNGQHIDDGGLWSWQEVSLQEILPGKTSQPNLPHWIVISRLPEQALTALKRGIWLPTVAVAGTAIAILAALSWLVAIRSYREREARESRLRADAVAAERSARVAALEQIQITQARLAAIVAFSQDAIISKELDGTITSWNAGAEELFGYSASEAIGQNIRMLIPVERLLEETDIIARVQSGIPVNHYETVRHHKDGHQIDVSLTVSPIRDAAERIVGASKIVRDISEAKRLHAELLRHQEQLEMLVEQRTAKIAETAAQLLEREKLITAVTDNIPGIVSYWDRDLRCRFANRGYISWFGMAPEDLIGRTMPEIASAENLERGLSQRDAVLRGEPQYFVREVAKPNGETGYLSVHYIPDIKNDEVIGFFVLAIDITAQQLAEDGLRALNSKLTDALALAQEANQAKSQFLANMSHEIRTPMNGVIGMLELLGHTALDADQLRMLQTIDSSAQSLLEIINDILDFSKIEAGQLKIEQIEVDVTEVVETTARLFLGAAAAKGITVRCFTSPTVRGPYFTDPVRLRQILSNLVSNAIKFTPRGSVTIIADTVPDGDGSTSLRLSVADTGIGISKEAQARLFQPFTQADGSTARKFGGAGLGLSICRRLAHLMEGKIELQSAEGVGTEVALTLPAKRLRAELDEPNIDLQDIKVGVMIDDALERNYLTAYLAHWGADVSDLPRDQERLRHWANGSLCIVLAPASVATEAGALGEGSSEWGKGEGLRYVFYTHEDLAADQLQAGDAILTTALSRARIVTAVAIAAGRQSPEIEMSHGLDGRQGAAVAPSRDQAIRDGRLILLAEDHPVNREVILRQLRFLGYSADAVEDGAQALAALAKNAYGLLLTDCNMPVMDGFKLVENIRRAEKPHAHLPVIALTANALEGEDQRCIAAGMDDYLSKPVELRVLRDRIERWLSPSSSAGPPPVLPSAPGRGGEQDRKSALDPALIAEFCGDDPVTIRQTLSMYVESLKSDFAGIHSAVDQRDAEAAELFAHRMKGAARTVGGRELVRHSEEVERLASEKEWGGILERMPHLMAAIAEAEAFVATMNANADPTPPRN
ncbi:PAS domain S-box protein [Dongia sp.]|uniref:PAS domain S-box protein n=1 Tax=Dongia sp. TaxID=1977262 RepID=UPI0035B4B6FD